MNKVRFEISERKFNSVTFRFEEKVRSIKKLIPDSWNELNYLQLLWVMKVMFITSSGDGKKDRERILFGFMRIPWKILKKLNESQVNALLPVFEFFYTGIQLTRQIIPNFRIFFTKYHGPSDVMENISAAEFAFADKYAYMYMQTQEVKYLNQLVAVLYRPRAKRKHRTPADIRQQFNDAYIEKRAKKMSWLDPRKKFAIFCFFLGSRAEIVKLFPSIFPSGKSQKKPPKAGWLGVFYEMSGSKMGTYKEVGEANFYVMLHLLDKIQTDAENERKKLKK